LNKQIKLLQAIRDKDTAGLSARSAHNMDMMLVIGDSYVEQMQECISQFTLSMQSVGHLLAECIETMNDELRTK
jgi:flagellar biosynthesis chaperone FliJ